MDDHNSLAYVYPSLSAFLVHWMVDVYRPAIIAYSVSVTIAFYLRLVAIMAWLAK